MTTLQVPGINISILRQQTVTQRGVPLLISGRVSALGLPVPALVRVTLEGPDFDPQVTNFDTFASPTGDYAVPVIADKDGQYTVQAKAYPPIAFTLFLVRSAQPHRCPAAGGGGSPGGGGGGGGGVPPVTQAHC